MCIINCPPMVVEEGVVTCEMRQFNDCRVLVRCSGIPVALIVWVNYCSIDMIKRILPNGSQYARRSRNEHPDMQQYFIISLNERARYSLLSSLLTKQRTVWLKTSKRNVTWLYKNTAFPSLLHTTTDLPRSLEHLKVVWLTI